MANSKSADGQEQVVPSDTISGGLLPTFLALGDYCPDFLTVYTWTRLLCHLVFIAVVKVGYPLVTRDGAVLFLQLNTAHNEYSSTDLPLNMGFEAIDSKMRPVEGQGRPSWRRI
jgi:hypothetical protein